MAVVLEGWMQGPCGVDWRTCVKPRPNDPNIVGRSMLRAFSHPVARCVGCCWLRFETGKSFHATFVDVA